MRFALLAIALLPLQLAAQVRDSIITVSATRTARVAPDRASLYVIVEGTAETATDAVARVDTKVKVVAEALKAMAGRVTIDPPVAYGVGPSPTPNMYPGVATPGTNLARSVMRVQLSRPEQTGSVVAAAIGAGASSSSSLTFESSVADSVRRARFADALGVARLDAEAIASSLGAKLGTLVSVSTSGAPFGFQQPSSLNFDSRFGQPASAPEVTISITVTVQYRLVR